MSRQRAYRIHQLDAVWDLIAGTFLVLAPFAWFSDPLDLPGLLTTFVSMAIGAITLVLAILLWRTEASRGSAQSVNAFACWGNAATTVVLLVIIIFASANLSAVSGVILAGAAAICGVFAFFEDRIARSGVLEDASPEPFLR